MPGFMSNTVGSRPPVRPPMMMPPVSGGNRTPPTFGGGPTPASPPRMPPQYGGGPTPPGGGPRITSVQNSAAGIVSGGKLDLPGSAGYAAKYRDWMRTPEADKVFKDQANQQANFANSLNPSSGMYNPDIAEKAKAAARMTDTYGQGAQGIREAMGQAQAMPPSAPGGAPMQNIAQPPPPPMTGVNAWQAASTLRKKMPGNTGPMRPQQAF